MLIETGVEEESAPPNKLRRGPDRRWHAVCIVPPGTACAAVQAHKGKRYLSADAPRLPLAHCDIARCDCKYRHYDDRRGVSRRRETGTPARQAINRRVNRGRREFD